MAFARREVEAGRDRLAHVYRLALLDVDWLRQRRDDIVARQPDLAANVDEATPVSEAGSWGPTRPAAAP